MTPKNKFSMMNMKLLALSLLLPLSCTPRLGVRGSGNNDKPQGAAVAYEYSYSNTMMYPVTYYRVNRGPAGDVKIAWSADNEPDIRVIRGPEDFFDRVDAIVKEYRLYKLKRSYLPTMEILDGYMWHAAIEFEGSYLSTGGSNAWPPSRLNEGIYAINGIISQCIDASTAADIIDRRSHNDR